MFAPKNLARTALASNGMVWFGLAVFFVGFAGERTHSALTVGGGVLAGWILLLVAAAGMVTMGTVEAVRLRRRMRIAAGD
ncbi:hypothetical protein ITJ42_15705 [Clavibacter michiganensis subsp. phaseoli]|uniref:Uncharacterized protein n=1 Tax=Clavibacter phaseoli TaxID=1734031 RepID=A0A8I0SFP7_9MICO|nr:hypothetical protein [Clavibacter phaseoli]MBF4632665.1 hypothetical protein [Clavibacter phaseoli]